VVDLKNNYYKRIEPSDAYVLQKNLKSDAIATQQQNGTADVVENGIDSN
jgi:hypothetical protein